MKNNEIIYLVNFEGRNELCKADLIYDINEDIIDQILKENHLQIYNPRIIATEEDIKVIAFDQVGAKYSYRIGDDWKNSKVTKVLLKEGMGNIKDTSYIGKEVYLVDFPLKNDKSQNSVIVYLDIDTYKLIGYGFTD